MPVKFTDYPWPIAEGRQVMAHQVETVKFLLANKNSYCFNDMGTGKTLCCLWGAHFLMLNQKLDKVLVVAPLSTMVSAWVVDLVKNIPGLRYAVAHGSREQRIAAIRSNVNFVVINHDGIKVCPEAIIQAGFGLVIIDELTAFKNYSADRTKVMERIARAIGPVWGVTGKPTPNSPVEAFGQAKVVNPFNPFVPRYFKQFFDLTMERINEYLSVPKSGANNYVHRMLQPAIRYTREQCVDLPPCTKTITRVEMSREQVQAYEKMRKALIVEYEEGLISASNAGVKALKLLQIASGAVKDDEGNVVLLDCKPRYDALLEVYEETPQDKLVVFAAFRANVEGIVQFFRKKKISAEAIYGSVDQRDRSEYIRRFQDGDLHVLVVQPQSAAHGITLTAANTIVWWSLVPSNEFYEQGNARIIRIGQTRRQQLIHLISSPAEMKMYNMLEAKNLQANDLLASFEDFLGAEIAYMDRAA